MRATIRPTRSTIIRLGLSIGLAIDLGCLGSTMAHAGELPSDSEITVTARGRVEAEIAVPDTIAVFTQADIVTRRLKTIDDFIAATPGIFMIHDQDPGTNLISVRGVSTNRSQSPSIAYIVDGLALPDSELFTLRPYDLARVEILKGPQGALFGRSASGGAVNMTTNDPTGNGVAKPRWASATA